MLALGEKFLPIHVRHAAGDQSLQLFPDLRTHVAIPLQLVHSSLLVAIDIHNVHSSPLVSELGSVQLLYRLATMG